LKPFFPDHFDPQTIAVPTIHLETDTSLWQFPIIDVRSEAEFAQGHLPHAVNMPLFSNAERAIIGTLYKQRGKEKAIEEGLKIVTPKLAGFVEKARLIANNEPITVHCWRGGMRSKSVAWWLAENGLQTQTLVGGYKAYRNWVRTQLALDGYSLIVIGGHTGSGKTELLHYLHQNGEQVIDLEALAQHRGSTFGALGLQPQPTIEQFENELCHQFLQLDPTRPIWIEAESRNIGKCTLPEPFWRKLTQSRRINLEVSEIVRVTRLVVEYGKFSPHELIAALRRIEKRLGAENTQKAIEGIETGDLATCVRVCLRYYDKNYELDRDKWNKQKCATLEANELFDQTTITELKKVADEMTNEIRLTQYSHGAGCGCKIAPKVLDVMLHSQTRYPKNPRLLVGNDTRDDATALDLGNGSVLVSTTDFFMPIVDDPFDFGRIAAANAISDVYAMGAKPILAIAILGWPVDVLPPEVAQQVLEGARYVCHEAGITLSGGHSIDNKEPLFGLSVNGIVPKEHLKKNSTATVGCQLYLTKPLGVGILTTAEKCGILATADQHLAKNSMTQLNALGEALGKLDYVRALTDVTGFGLLGHLSEMCEGSELTAILDFAQIPMFSAVGKYVAQGCFPGGTTRNFDSYGHKIAPLTDFQRTILCDPQTNGGLLIAVDAAHEADFKAFLTEKELELTCFGHLVEKQAFAVMVE
jgi:selenide, water dikinase